MFAADSVSEDDLYSEDLLVCSAASKIGSTLVGLVVLS